MNEGYNNRQQYARKTIDAVRRTLPEARKMGFGDELVTEVAKYAGGSTDKVFMLYTQRSSEMMGKGLTPLDLAKAAHNIGHIETNYADRLAFVALIPAADTAELAENGAVEDIINRNTAISMGTARHTGLRSQATGNLRYRHNKIRIALSELTLEEMAEIGRMYDPYNRI